MTTKNTPKAIAKKERNIAAAAERLKNLQAKQALLKLLRQPGVREALAEKARLANEAVTNARAEAARLEAIAAFKKSVEAQYVRDALNGPSSKLLVKWLAGREETFERVERFFKERPQLVAPSGIAPLSRVA